MVGRDCPYYDFGDHTMAKLRFDRDGNVIDIAGPWGEKYKRVGDSDEKPNLIDGTFKHNYLGGSLKFNVDVSDVGCNCAAGVFLVHLDDDKCNMGEYEGSSKP